MQDYMKILFNWIPAKAGTGIQKKQIMFEKQPFIYMLSSKQNRTRYTCVTRNLAQRIYQHKHDLAEGLHKINVNLPTCF